MKFIKNSLIIICSFCLLTAIACKQNTANQESSEVVDKDGTEYTSAYVCPMHCKGSGSTEPGKCPVCGMNYVENVNYKTNDDHSHDGHDHDGHDHSHGEDGHNHGDDGHTHDHDHNH